ATVEPSALATSVACNSAPSMGLFARASSIIRGQRARTRSTVKGPFSGGGTAGEEGRGKGVTGAASRSTGAVSLFSLPSSPCAGDELAQVGAGSAEPVHQREDRFRVALGDETE